MYKKILNILCYVIWVNNEFLIRHLRIGAAVDFNVGLSSKK